MATEAASTPSGMYCANNRSWSPTLAGEAFGRACAATAGSFRSTRPMPGGWSIAHSSSRPLSLPSSSPASGWCEADNVGGPPSLGFVEIAPSLLHGRFEREDHHSGSTTRETTSDRCHRDAIRLTEPDSVVRELLALSRHAVMSPGPTPVGRDAPRSGTIDPEWRSVGLPACLYVGPPSSRDPSLREERLADRCGKRRAAIPVDTDSRPGPGGRPTKPPPLRPAVPRGFDHDDFEIDAQAATMTCPAGITVALTAKGRATFGANCRACPLPAVAPRHEAAARSCSIPITTISPPVGPRPDRGVQRRLYWRWRPMVERTLAWLTRGTTASCATAASSATSCGGRIAVRLSTCSA